MTTQLIVEVLPDGDIAVTSDVPAEVAVFDYRDLPGDYVPPMVDIKGMYHHRARAEVVDATLHPAMVAAAVAFASRVRDARHAPASGEAHGERRWRRWRTWLLSRLGAASADRA